MPHGRGIPIIGDIPPTPGAPGPEQGGAPIPPQVGPPSGGFSPRTRAKRLLRQAAGLQPASDVQPRSGLAPAIEAALNLQLSEGLISQEAFNKAVGRPATTATTAATPEAGRRTSLRAGARKVRARRAGLIAGATQAASGPLVASPGLLPQIADLFGTRRRQTF